MNNTQTNQAPSPMWAGNILLPLRLVLGWTYFSAFWRRLVLENKLDMDGAGYVGEKFNHFLPNALLIQSPIEFFLLRPELLWWKLLLFTLFEAVVGLALIFGIATRAAGIAVSALALGILLGAGWLGTTCLDEWQVGLLGIAGGLAVFFGGGGSVSLDAVIKRRTRFNLSDKFQWVIEPGPVMGRFFRKAVVPSALVLAFVTLATNQIFHGGVYGTLHNKSVKPMVEITDTRVIGNRVTAQFFRVEGADVYGSFAIAVRLVDGSGESVIEWNSKKLSAMKPGQFENRYIAKVRAGKNSMILPLGAKADVTLIDDKLLQLPTGEYLLELEDVSGTVWSAPVQIDNRTN